MLCAENQISCFARFAVPFHGSGLFRAYVWEIFKDWGDMVREPRFPGLPGSRVYRGARSTWVLPKTGAGSTRGQAPLVAGQPGSCLYPDPRSPRVQFVQEVFDADPPCFSLAAGIQETPGGLASMRHLEGGLGLRKCSQKPPAHMTWRPWGPNSMGDLPNGRLPRRALRVCCCRLYVNHQHSSASKGCQGRLPF